jgi:hypothetical protein
MSTSPPTGEGAGDEGSVARGPGWTPVMPSVLPLTAAVRTLPERERLVNHLPRLRVL